MEQKISVAGIIVGKEVSGAIVDRDRLKEPCKTMNDQRNININTFFNLSYKYAHIVVGYWGQLKSKHWYYP